jgi:hypothetical protein
LSSQSARTHYHKHHVGEGRHLINDNFVLHEDGSYQFGDPSDICILLNAQRLCSAYDLPAIWELWTLSFPDDPMWEDDAATIIDEALPFTAPCDPTIPDDRLSIIKDLRLINLVPLAEKIETLLKGKGTYC